MYTQFSQTHPSNSDWQFNPLIFPLKTNKPPSLHGKTRRFLDTKKPRVSLPGLIPKDLQAAIPLGRIQGFVGQQAAENFSTVDPIVDGLSPDSPGLDDIDDRWLMDHFLGPFFMDLSRKQNTPNIPMDFPWNFPKMTSGKTAKMSSCHRAWGSRSTKFSGIFRHPWHPWHPCGIHQQLTGLQTLGAFFRETRFINEHHRASARLLARCGTLPLIHRVDSSLLVNLLIFLYWDG